MQKKLIILDFKAYHGFSYLRQHFAGLILYIKMSTKVLSSVIPISFSASFVANSGKKLPNSYRSRYLIKYSGFYLITIDFNFS